MRWMPDMERLGQVIKESNFTKLFADEIIRSVNEEEGWKEFFAKNNLGAEAAEQLAAELPAKFLEDGAKAMEELFTQVGIPAAAQGEAA
jgi:hypothetical protein